MSRFERWSPLVGVLAVALWIAGFAVISHDNPPDHATDSQILVWYRGNSNWVLLGGFLFMLGCLAFLWFATILRERLDDAGAGRKASSLTFAGAVAATVLGIAIPLTEIAAAINKDDISAATAGAAHRLSDGFFIGAEIALVVVFAAAAVAALQTRLLPKWWAWLMLLVAVVLVIGPIGWAGLIFGTPIWILGTTLLLLLRTRGNATRVVPAAT